MTPERTPPPPPAPTSKLPLPSRPPLLPPSPCSKLYRPLPAPSSTGLSLLQVLQTRTHTNALNAVLTHCRTHPTHTRVPPSRTRTWCAVCCVLKPKAFFWTEPLPASFLFSIYHPPHPPSPPPTHTPHHRPPPVRPAQPHAHPPHRHRASRPTFRLHDGSR